MCICGRAHGQRNIKILKVDGVNVMDPDEGLLAEGYSGKGRFPENTTVMQYIEKNCGENYSNLASLKKKDFDNCRHARIS